MSPIFVALFQVVTIFYSASASDETITKGDLPRVLESLGYHTLCTSSSLSLCELLPDEKLPLFNVIKSLFDELKALRQEVNLMKENERNNSEFIKEQLGNVTISQSVMQTSIQEVKSEVANITKSLSKESTISVDDVMESNQETSTEETTTTTTASTTPQPHIGPNCADLRVSGDTKSGVRTVYPEGPLSPEVLVFCDQLLDDGGWTVIQNRDDLPVRISFERSWEDYVGGFGDPKGEFWLGLDNMHALTNSTPMQLRVDMEDWEGEKRWAKYSTFRVGDQASKYLLSVGGYTGNAGDGGNGMTYNNGKPFSAYDQDNDSSSSRNCAKEERGGWWFFNCALVNPNGYPHKGEYTGKFDEGIVWYPFRRAWYSLKKISLKIRPV